MMGEQKQERALFSYAINLEKRVRSDHPLRRVAAVLDFSFVRAEVAHCYGKKGNVSVDPEVILKLMFLLFFDDVASERELMKIVAERLDYLWFLGYGLEDEIPDHSVLSKARARWGKEVFERLFVRTISQCLAAGLIDGRKLHLDSSLIAADAAKESVIKGPPELIAALKRAYEVTESKLEEAAVSYYKPVNECLLSKTDPDAAMVRRGRGDSSRPRYHHHRAVDDAKGVITAVETTSGSVAENHKLIALVEQHEAHTQRKVEVAVADQKYGTQENYVACAERGIASHMGDFSQGQTNNHHCRGIFADTAFKYEATTNTYRCPAGETLYPRRLHPVRRTMEYAARKGVCAQCQLRTQCTRAKLGRTVKRHEKQAALDLARAQAHSPAAERDRARRRHLMEGSFADAANNHHFKRARWQRLWRQQIQDYLIAVCQNLRILLRHGGEGHAANLIALPGPKGAPFQTYFSSLKLELRRLWFYFIGPHFDSIYLYALPV
jgi:transposase